MWEHFRTNLVYRIISIVLAVILWAWVTAEKNPIKETLLEVPLETRQLTSELMVAEKPSLVKVRVQGREHTLDNLTSRDIQVYVDLSSARPGANIEPIEIALPKGVELVSATPSKASVIIDQVSEVQLPITIKVVGEAADGYQVLEPAVDPSEILVAGPKSILDRIGEVQVSVSLTRQRESYLERVPVRISDQAGNSIHEWLKMQPATAEVFVPVVRDLPVEKFIIKPKLAGDLPGRFSFKQVKVTPEIIDIYGKADVLQTLDYIYTQEIQLDEIEKTTVLDTELDLPEGTYTGGMSRVKVIIEVE
jgi:YbbR domain-containing protein